MKNKTLSTFAIILFSFNAWAIKSSDVILVDISKIGHANLETLKSNDKISYWVELGSELLIITNDIADFPLPSDLKPKQIVKNINPELLFIEVKGLCHSHFDQDKRHKTSSLYIQSLYEIKLAKTTEEKEDYITKPCFSNLNKNKNVISLAQNLPASKKLLTADPDLVEVLKQVNEERWLNNVKYLSSFNRMEEQALITTGNWLSDKFTNLGLIVEHVDDDSYFGFNVIGTKIGTTRPDEWYVIGAHLDSMNGAYSTTIASPGAEDNASGCSGVIESAEILSQYESEATIKFICFAGHERAKIIPDGQLTTTNGSAQIVNNWRLSGQLDKVKAMLNMDMISYHEGGSYLAMASNAHNVSLELLDTFLTNARIYTDIDWTVLFNWRVSDHKRFSARGVPSIMSSETTLREYFGYHSPDDIWQNVDPYLGAQIIKANISTLAKLSRTKFTESNTFPIRPTHSGLWYNAAQSGHGYTVLVLPNNQINAQWYVYDDVGNQVWLIGTGTYDEGSNQASIEMTITQNGLFPPEFIPENVEVQTWGTLTFQFDDCFSGLASWNPLPEFNQFSSGSMSITKLAEIRGLTDCQNNQ